MWHSRLQGYYDGSADREKREYAMELMRSGADMLKMQGPLVKKTHSVVPRI